MKNLLILIFLFSSALAFAEDTIRIDVRLLELEPSAAAPTEFPTADSTPLSFSTTGKVGQEASIALSRPLKLPDVSSEVPIEIPLGITLHVTPVLKGTQLTYRAQVAHSIPVFQTRVPMPHSAAEIETRTFYQSGPCKPGEAIWFSYKNPENGKTMLVALRLSNQAP